MIKIKFKGFTISETMVSLFITVVLVTISSTVIISCLMIFGRNANMRNAQIEGDTVFGIIYNKLSVCCSFTSDNMSFITDFPENSRTEEIVSDGYTIVLKCEEEDKEIYIFGNEKNRESQNKICTLILNNISDSNCMISFTVNIKYNEDLVFSKTGIVPLLNSTDKSIILSDIEDDEVHCLQYICRKSEGEF